jgi:integrase
MTTMPAPTAITDPKWIKKIYESIGGRKKEQKQDLYLVALISGAHSSILANPHKHDPHFDGRVCDFRRTKESSRKRNVLVRIVVPEPGHYIPVSDARATEAFKRWLDPYADVNGFPRSRKTVDKWFRELGKKAKYPRPLSPGTFRHTFCYQDLKAHKDLMRTMNKMRCSIGMITNNYGLLGAYDL